jgi:gas vesicle protein
VYVGDIFTAFQYHSDSSLSICLLYVYYLIWEETPMKVSRNILLLITILLTASLLIGACSDETKEEADEAGAAIENAGEEVGDVAEEAGEDVEEGAEEAGEELEEAGEEAAEELEEASEELEEDVEEVGEELEEGAEEAAEDVEEASEELEEDVEEVGEDIEEASEELEEDVEEVGEDVEEGVEEAGEEIEEAGEEVEEDVEEASEEIEEAAAVLGENIRSFFDSLRVNIDAELDEVAEDLEEVGEEIEEGAEEAAEDVEEAGEELEEAGEEAGEEIEEGAEEVAEDVEEAGEDIEQEIDEIAEESDVNLNSFQNAIFVVDQAIVNDSVLIEEVEFEDDGFVVIHADDGDGNPGEVIGQIAFESEEMDEFSVEVDRDKVTSKLYVMLHEDTGEEGVYEFGDVEDADGPVQIDGETAVIGFNVFMIEPADQAYNADNNTLTLDTVVSARNTWLVVYSDEDREDRIGMTLLEAGRNEGVTVELDSDAEVGDTVWVVLHDDTGEEGEFEFDDDDEIDDPIVVNLDEVRFSIDLATENVESEAEEED